MTVLLPRRRSPSGHAVYSMAGGAKLAEPANDSADFVWEVSALAGRRLSLVALQVDLTVGGGDTLRRKIVYEYADGTTMSPTGNQSNTASTTQQFGSNAFLNTEPDLTKRIVKIRLYAWHDSALNASSIDATRATIWELQ